MALTRSKAFLFWVPSLLVMGLSFWLRTESSQLRLFHADEGVQSYQAWRLIETGEYRYDPSEHHGPLLYYVAKWAAPLLRSDRGELTDSGMRRVPMLFSLGTLALGLWAFRRYGSAAALLWGLIVAASPLCVIYGSYFIQEALLCFFTLVFLLAAYRYGREPSGVNAAALGLALGLMHVTKETAVLHVAAIAVSGFAVAWVRRVRVKASAATLLKHATLALGLALLLHGLFFSSFFRNPQGVLDGFSSFFSYAERSLGQGHEKPWFYYLTLLLPQTLEGARWGELAFLVASGLGLVRCFCRIKGCGFTAYVAGSGLGLLVLYSLIPYKNPWLLLTPYCLLAYAAAFGVVDLLKLGFAETERMRKISLLAAGCGALVFLGLELRSNLRKAVVHYASASRNPYLYMHTTPRYTKLLDRLESVRGQASIRVFSPDAAWPLPWHLRSWERVGYWKTFEGFESESIDIIDTRLLSDREDLMSSGGFWELHGLRPNTLLVLRASDEIGEKWIAANAKN